MRRIYTIVICTAASLGLGFAQDIPTDTKSALAKELKDPAKTTYCLTALRLYTTYTAKAGDVPMSPTDAAKAALSELLQGAPDNKDLFTVAQKQPDFLDWLAKANGPPKDPPVQEHALFADEVARIVEKIYGISKQALADVQEASAQKSNDLAIFELLDAYPKDHIDAAYANDLEFLREGYQINADRLFKLVSDKIIPAKK